MDERPRLVSGTCPACSGTEIVVKRLEADGTNYEGYCPSCGVDLYGALVGETAKAALLKFS